jgi:dihydrofolate synthase/folylpolyglutamate synthase
MSVYESKDDNSLKGIYTPTGYDASYSNLLDALYSVNGKLSRSGVKAPSEEALVNTRRLYELLGKPLDSIPTVHVGGTNGKGTTSFKISQCAHLSGLKVGLFVSPHIACFRERVQVGHELISEANMLEYLPQILRLCVEHTIPATMFEVTFLLAAMYFGRVGCDIVVLEVGVGGELDATNVVSTALSIICSVALDHTRILGATVEEIATKKGGIFKKDVPALVGPNCPIEVLENIASSKGAILYTTRSAAEKFSLELPATEVDGVMDPDGMNAFLSTLALHILSEPGGPFADKTLFKGIAGCGLRPPCRWEEFRVRVTSTTTTTTSSSSNGSSGGLNITAVGPDEQDHSDPSVVQVILDVGHNPAAVDTLMKRVHKQFISKGAQVRVVYAVSRDKNVRECVRAIVANVAPDKVHFAQSTNWRAASLEELNRIFREETGENVTDMGAVDCQETLKRVLARSASDGAASGGKAVTIICGTGYIMPPARALVGIREPQDDEDISRSSLSKG